MTVSYESALNSFTLSNRGRRKETRLATHTAWRVTFRSGTVTRHGTRTWVDVRVIKIVSSLLLLPSPELSLLRKGCSGSGGRNKRGSSKQTILTPATVMAAITKVIM